MSADTTNGAREFIHNSHSQLAEETERIDNSKVFTTYLAQQHPGQIQAEKLSKMPPNEAPMTAAFIEDSDDRTASRPAVAAVPDGQIRVEDKLYSTQKLADLHPGGPLFVKVTLL